MFFTTYLPLIFGLNVPFLRSLFVIRSSARAARTVICSFIVRLLFVHCSSFVRLLFVHCSSFVRSLFVHCSSFVRSLFVHCSFIVRLLFVHCSSFHYLPVVLRLPVCLTPARTARTVYHIRFRINPPNSPLIINH